MQQVLQVITKFGKKNVMLSIMERSKRKKAERILSTRTSCTIVIVGAQRGLWPQPPTHHGVAEEFMKGGE